MCPHAPYEIELMMAGVKPVAIIRSDEVSLEMSRHIQSGRIVLIGDYNAEQIGLVQVYAQTNKIDEGKEVYARYFNDNKGYTPLKGKAEVKRIGELLGYSEIDIACVTQENYYSFWTSKILENTHQMRRWARKEYMLHFQEQAPT